MENKKPNESKAEVPVKEGGMIKAIPIDILKQGEPISKKAPKHPLVSEAGEITKLKGGSWLHKKASATFQEEHRRKYPQLFKKVSDKPKYEYEEKVKEQTAEGIPVSKPITKVISIDARKQGAKIKEPVKVPIHKMDLMFPKGMKRNIQ